MERAKSPDGEDWGASSWRWFRPTKAGRWTALALIRTAAPADHPSSASRLRSRLIAGVGCGAGEENVALANDVLTAASKQLPSE